MKHNVKVTLILIGMFLIAQIIGLVVTFAYLPETVQITNQETGEVINVTTHNLPYDLEPPEEISPSASFTYIVVALVIAILLMFVLMKMKAETVLRGWFLLVVILGIAIAFTAFLLLVKVPLLPASIVAIVIAIPIGILKIFKRNLYVHNITELLIYPGIASVFIPLFNIKWTVILLFGISAYDIYAVWHSGFMQKMAKYQIEKLKIFSGFFVPYISPKDKKRLERAKKSKSKKKGKGISVNIAILGGGDVVFPIILSGVVLTFWGLIPAFLVSLGATAALSLLFLYSQKGKFYPAMPFITAGCLVGLGLGYLVTLI